MKPKLTLRDLFWLVVVVAVFTAWGLDHWRQAVRIEQLSPTTRESYRAEIDRRIDEFNRRQKKVGDVEIHYP